MEAVNEMMSLPPHRQHEFEGVLDGTETKPDPLVDQAAVKLWNKRELFIQSALVSGADKNDHIIFNQKGTGKKMWDALFEAKIHRQQSRHIYVLGKMNMYEPKPKFEFEDCLNALETKRRRMEDLAHPVSGESFANLIQTLVDGRYRDVIRYIESFARGKGHAPTVEETVSAIRSEIQVNKYMGKREFELYKEEQTQPSIHMVLRSDKGSKKRKQFSKKYKSSQKPYGRQKKKDMNFKASNPEESGDYVETRTCFMCNTKGHIDRDCTVDNGSGDNVIPDKRRWGPHGKKGKNQIHLVLSADHRACVLLLDCGSGVHVCSNPDALKNVEKDCTQ
ncbi:hypothetical protein PsorP6_009280 [Peronosclerospora sorghi]|uniref:Uncharacterized protein n=1 Tax=Peronosclerospora sorghi TaxID=230839 RepID=A0ACC0VYD4_9STRA|nr:hypothetical protein PsorP6_009280 [Peronosclerospora sorghi]